MSAGRFLIYSLLSEVDEAKRRSNYHALQASGITEEWFLNSDERRAYNFICGFFLNHGVLPSVQIIEAEGFMTLPSYRLYEPFEYFLGLFKSFYKETLIEETLAQIQEHHTKDESEARDAKLYALVSKLADFESTSKTTRLLSEVTQENLDRHRELQQKISDGGVRFGIPALDAVTGGAQKGDLWIIAGNSGSGKSYVTCRMAMAAVLGRNPETIFNDMEREQNPELGVLYDIGAIREEPIVTWPRKRALYISMEMPNAQIGMRDASLASRVSGSSFRLGKLPDLSVRMIEAFLRRWREWELDDKLILVEGSITMTVKDVLHKIKEHKPDIVFIDGAYMLRLDGKAAKSRWETIMNTTEILKKAAMAEDIPIIATFQFDQKAKEQKLDTIMGGQAIGQIASVAIGLSDHKEGSTSNAAQVQFKKMSLIKGRNGEQGDIFLRFDMDRSIISESGSSGLSVDYDDGAVPEIDHYEDHFRTAPSTPEEDSPNDEDIFLD